METTKASSPFQTNIMDRGSDVLKSHLNRCDQMEIVQTRRGWCQDEMGCAPRTEFNYFVGTDHIATSLEEADPCYRIFCDGIHPYRMEVNELHSGLNIVTVDRPFACHAANCKCCCYQEASFLSGDDYLGRIQEDFYYCIPQFVVYDNVNRPMYKIHPPTCCSGVFVDCCAEGNPFGRGCCRQSFRVYPFSQENTDGDAPYVGKILKKPISVLMELFTNAEIYVLDFPSGSSAAQKGTLIGSTIFLNSIFFQGEHPDGIGA
ncbi:MAG: hypothetical protein SGBAC_001142 [Bacillariaceae sp.]